MLLKGFYITTLYWYATANSQVFVVNICLNIKKGDGTSHVIANPIPYTIIM